MASYRIKKKMTKKHGVRYGVEIRDNKGKTLYSATFATKKDADLDAKTKIGQYSINATKSTENMEEAMERYFRLYPQKRQTEHLARVRRFFGATPLGKITFESYQTFFNDTAYQLGQSSLSRLNNLLVKVVKLARRGGVMIPDFQSDVEIKSHKTNKSVKNKYLHSLADINRFEKYLKAHFDFQEDNLNYYFYIMLKGAFRPGEAEAITWDDIDWKKGFISTYRRYNSALCKFVQPKNYNHYTKNPEENPSIRDVAISKEVITVLKQLKSEQEKWLEVAGINNPDNLIFYHFRYESGFAAYATANKAIKEILKKLNIPDFQNYSQYVCRHSRGSELLQQTRSELEVAHFMGHANTRMIREIYGHLLDEDKDELVELIQSVA